MKVCAEPGCPQLIERGVRWCPTHRPKAPPRPKTAARGYGGRWQKFRRRYLAEHPLCVACGAPATDLDHIDGEGPLGPGGYDPGNLQALCRSCHSRKTYHADGAFGRPRLPR